MTEHHRVDHTNAEIQEEYNKHTLHTCHTYIHAMYILHGHVRCTCTVHVVDVKYQMQTRLHCLLVAHWNSTVWSRRHLLGCSRHSHLPRWGSLVPCIEQSTSSPTAQVRTYMHICIGSTIYWVSYTPNTQVCMYSTYSTYSMHVICTLMWIQVHACIMHTCSTVTLCTYCAVPLYHHYGLCVCTYIRMCVPIHVHRVRLPLSPTSCL